MGPGSGKLLQPSSLTPRFGGFTLAYFPISTESRLAARLAPADTHPAV